MDSVREGEGGKIWENGIETCKISCINERILSPGNWTEAVHIASLQCLVRGKVV